jgi:hypothetical protein
MAMHLRGRSDRKSSAEMARCSPSFIGTLIWEILLTLHARRTPNNLSTPNFRQTTRLYYGLRRRLDRIY